MEKIELDDRYKKQFRDILRRAIEELKEYRLVKLSDDGRQIIVKTYDSFEYRISLNVTGYEE